MAAPTHNDHICNFEVLKMAKATLGGFSKFAFVPAGDAAGGDPSQGGGDPSQGGGDPSGGGGPPPGGDPSGGGGGGGGGGMDPNMVQQMVQQAVQQAMAQQGGGGMGGGAAGGAGGALKPKVDTNAVLLQILKIQARIADQLGVKIPASEMVVNQQDLGQLAAATQTGQPMPGMDPTAAGGAGGAGGGDPSGGGGAIPPMDGMQGMQAAGQPGQQKAGSAKRAWRGNGQAYEDGGAGRLGFGDSTLSDGLGQMHQKAAAILATRKRS